jgi:hypothetical protein
VISWLRSIRLTFTQLALVAAASALATALIIGSATDRGGVPTAMVAALRHPVVVHTVPRKVVARAPAQSAAASPVSGPAPATVPSSAPASAPSSPPASTPASPASSSAGGADGGDGSSSAGDGGGGSGGGDGSDPGGTGAGTPPAASTTPATPTYKVKHVFLIALSTTTYRATFGSGSVARYLNRRLRARGTLLSGYETLGPAELPDYFAMISGQASNADTRADCPIYAEFPPGAKAAADGQISGRGCVYPNTVLTIGDQVTASGRQWKAYIDDMGSSSCLHPNSSAADDAPLPGAGSQYATRHNPFIYFHSLLDLGDCSSDDVTLDRLSKDLRSAAHTPAFSFIAPGTCDDALAAVCPDGQPGGLAGEDAFLKLWVPRILGSAAYKRDGALIIAFATSPRAPGNSPDQRPVRTGALIISRYTKSGHTVSAPYDPYSLLRSVEDLFGYTPLARAATPHAFLATALPNA